MPSRCLIAATHRAISHHTKTPASTTKYLYLRRVLHRQSRRSQRCFERHKQRPKLLTRSAEFGNQHTLHTARQQSGETRETTDTPPRPADAREPDRQRAPIETGLLAQSSRLGYHLYLPLIRHTRHLTERSRAPDSKPTIAGSAGSVPSR
jgi:hypothetical protein